MKNEILELGKKMMVECPDNDCIVYLNVYKMYCGVNDDLNGCLLSEHGRMVLTHERDKLLLELQGMYLTNYAVRQYRKDHR